MAPCNECVLTATNCVENCPEGCEECESEDKCTKAKDGYYLEGDIAKSNNNYFNK